MGQVACVEHVWELREIAFDLAVGSLETRVCLRCGAVTTDRPAGHRPDVKQRREPR